MYRRLRLSTVTRNSRHRAVLRVPRFLNAKLAAGVRSQRDLTLHNHLPVHALRHQVALRRGHTVKDLAGRRPTERRGGIIRVGEDERSAAAVLKDVPAAVELRVRKRPHGRCSRHPNAGPGAVRCNELPLRRVDRSPVSLQEKHFASDDTGDRGPDAQRRSDEPSSSAFLALFRTMMSGWMFMRDVGSRLRFRRRRGIRIDFQTDDLIRRHRYVGPYGPAEVFQAQLPVLSAAGDELTRAAWTLDRLVKTVVRQHQLPAAVETVDGIGHRGGLNKGRNDSALSCGVTRLNTTRIWVRLPFVAISYIIRVPPLTKKGTTMLARLAGLALAALLLPGALRAEDKRNFLFIGEAASAKVEGTVTLDGQPLAKAKVTFHSTDEKGRVLSAMTDEDGKYRLTVGKKDNAVPGTFRVTIEKKIDGKETLPPSYADKDKAGLMTVIQKGGNVFDLVLKSR